MKWVNKILSIVVMFHYFYFASEIKKSSIKKYVPGQFNVSNKIKGTLSFSLRIVKHDLFDLKLSSTSKI